MSYRAAFSAFYARNFERRPWVTLAVTNGALGVLADGVAQSLERVSVTQQRERDPKSAPPESGNEAWDWERSGRFLAFGVGMAPLLAEWNRFIEFRFPLRSAAGVVRLSALAKRVAVDQIAFAPFGLALFTGAMGLMERRSIEGTKDKFDEMYISALLANWQVWPLVQVINFRYMPLKYRVPFVSAVGILWNIGLSLLSKATSNKPRAALTALPVAVPEEKPSTSKSEASSTTTK